MWWRLMDDAITESDKLKLIEFISSNDMYTCGKKVEEFENEWSKYIELFKMHNPNERKLRFKENTNKYTITRHHRQNNQFVQHVPLLWETLNCK